MLEYISGTVVATSKGVVILDIHGIGIKVQTPTSLSQTLQKGKEVKLFTSLSLKNEEMHLYGFENFEERQMFECLQSVSGIGPALSLNILSALSLPTLYQAILKEDLGPFKGVKGVGPKTAQRIVLELKGNLPKEFPTLSLSSASADSLLQSEAIKALLALGYSQEIANRAVMNACQRLQNMSGVDLAGLIREALSEVSS